MMCKNMASTKLVVFCSIVVFLLAGCAAPTQRNEHWSAEDFSVSPDVPKRINLRVAYFSDISNQDVWLSTTEHVRATAELYDAGLALLQNVFTSVSPVKKDQDLSSYDLYVVFKGDYNKFSNGKYTTIFDAYNAATFTLIETYSRTWLWEKLGWEMEEAKKQLRKDFTHIGNTMMRTRAKLIAGAGKKVAKPRKKPKVAVDQRKACKAREANLEEGYRSLKANQKMETCAKIIASNEILRKFVKLYDRCLKIDPQGDKARSYQFKLRRSLDTKARMCP